MRPLVARCHHCNAEAFLGGDLGRQRRVGLPGTLRPCHGGASGEGASACARHAGENEYDWLIVVKNNYG